MPRKHRAPETWKAVFGKKGRGRVTVEELTPGGLLRARVWEPTRNKGRGGYRKVALGHRDKDRAERWALEEQQRLAKVLDGHTPPRGAEEWATVQQLLRAYLRLKTPAKSGAEQAADTRRAALWLTVLGGRTDIRALDVSTPGGAGV